jgi:cell fate regulator YaaT (PSP1 superfamily)
MDDGNSKKEISYLPRSYGAERSRIEPPRDDGPGRDEEDQRADDSGGSEETVEERESIPPSQESERTRDAEEGRADAAVEPEEKTRTADDRVPEPPEEAQTEAEVDTVKVGIVGVRFLRAGKVYHFDSAGVDLTESDWVIVKTEKGIGLGQVAFSPIERDLDRQTLEGLRKVVRKAGKVDFDQKARCRQREAQAYTYCLERIADIGLPMKLVAVECFFDGSKYVFYFTAEGRVDFRELVKQLVSRFPVRIEMRQIGVRHEAKMTGGLGCCGQELCCCRFLTDFKPVSVKMAKSQNLSLNPSKISGVCGRLMCCLAYEHDIYEQFKKAVPKVGKGVKTTQGEGQVQKHCPLTESLVVKLADETLVEVTKDEIVGNDAGDPKKRKSKPPRKNTKARSAKNKRGRNSKERNARNGSGGKA